MRHRQIVTTFQHSGLKAYREVWDDFPETLLYTDEQWVLQPGALVMETSEMYDIAGSPFSTNPLDHSKWKVEWEDSTWESPRRTIPAGGLHTVEWISGSRAALWAFVVGDDADGWGISFPSLDTSFPTHRLKLKVLSGLHPDSFLGLEFARDLLHTIAGIRKGTAKTIAAQIQRVLRSKTAARRIGRATNFGAGSFLAYQFGLKPLIGDLTSIWSSVMTAKSRQRALPKEKLRFRGVVSDAAAVPKDPMPNVDGISSSCQISRLEKKSTLTMTVPAQSIREGTASFIFKSFRLGDWLSTAWEWIPFSFCVDWFVDVDKMIDNIGSTAGYDRLSGVETRSIKVTQLAELTIKLVGLNYVGALSRPGDFEVVCGSVKSTRFYRNLPMTDGGSSFVDKKGFNTPRAKLFTALLVQQIAKRINLRRG